MGVEGMDTNEQLIACEIDEHSTATSDGSTEYFTSDPSTLSAENGDAVVSETVSESTADDFAQKPAQSPPSKPLIRDGQTSSDVNQGEVMRLEDQKIDDFGKSVEGFQEVANAAEGYYTRSIRESIFSVDTLRVQARELGERRDQLEIERAATKAKVVAAEEAENEASRTYSAESASFLVERQTFENITNRLTLLLEAVQKQPDDHASVKPTLALFEQLYNDLSALREGTYSDVSQFSEDGQTEPKPTVSMRDVLMKKAAAHKRMTVAEADLAMKEQDHREEQAEFVRLSQKAEDDKLRVDQEIRDLVGVILHKEVVDAFDGQPGILKGLVAAVKKKIEQKRSGLSSESYLSLSMVPDRQELNP